MTTVADVPPSHSGGTYAEQRFNRNFFYPKFL
jgi:hypothetical protein